MEQMRKDKFHLENEVRELLRGYVEKHGHCDIKLSSQLIYEHFHSGKIELVQIEVDAKISI